jgi:hypothetical protein
VPYLNLDDHFALHPKVDALSAGAFRLHVSGLCYCAMNLTNGQVDKRRVSRLMPDYKPAFLCELLESAMWVEKPDCYDIHDYLDWNKSRDWWEAKREADAKRLAKWRQRNAARNDEEDAS